MILPQIDDLTLMAGTVLMEAGGESFEGKVAVAWVIVNRDAKTKDEGLDDVVWSPFQFSAWNTDNKMRAALQTRMLHEPALWNECMKAGAAALWGFIPDPTHGANMYLNPALTKQIRGGTLPDWYDASKVTAVIGHHEFLKI